MRKGNEQWGLVFAGGGGKGAYEIGAWRAIRELCREINIVSVAGTSVGALNAVLYAIGDYDLAYDIWRYQVNSKVILANKPKDEMKNLILNQFMNISAIKNVKKELLAYYMMPAGLGYLALAISNYLTSAQKLLNEGIFSRDGLKEIIVRNKIISRMNQSSMPCYAACYNLTDKKAEYFDLRNRDEENFIDILLASSAIPFIFPVQRMNNKRYLDGFLKDNIPFKKLYDEGVKNLFVVHLNHGKSYVDTTTYQDAILMHLYPQKSLKGPIGVIDFRPDVLEDLMQQGYRETKENLNALNIQC